MIRFLLVCFLTSFLYRVAVEQVTQLFNGADGDDTLTQASAFLDSVSQQDFSLDSLNDMANQAEKDLRERIANLTTSDWHNTPISASNTGLSNTSSFGPSSRSTHTTQYSDYRF